MHAHKYKLLAHDGLIFNILENRDIQDQHLPVEASRVVFIIAVNSVPLDTMK